MKKALGFAVALGLVAGMASSAMAEDMLSINGDARLRGYYKTNTDLILNPTELEPSDANADKIQKMDQRYRVNVDLKINDDVKVSTRFVLMDQDFGNNNETDTDSTFQVDRAHMTINMLGGTYLLGRQNTGWGNKFASWGVQSDRIKAVYKNGDLTYGAYLQKSTEGDDVFGDGDEDVYAAFVVGKAGDTKWGVLANYLYNDTQVDNGASQDGQLIDAFFTTRAGSATIMGEVLYSGGDAGENESGDAFYGGFVGGAMNMDAVTVKGLVALWDGNMGSTGGRDCDNDFAPTLLIGTCNETAIIDFGETTRLTDDSTYLVSIAADMKVNDKLTLSGGLAYLLATEEAGINGTDDGTLIEIDLSLKYALVQNATYSLGLAYGIPDELSVADDDIIVIGNRIDVKW
jgi:hypothetical protein